MRKGTASGQDALTLRTSGLPPYGRHVGTGNMVNLTGGSTGPRLSTRPRTEIVSAAIAGPAMAGHLGQPRNEEGHGQRSGCLDAPNLRAAALRTTCWHGEHGESHRQ